MTDEEFRLIRDLICDFCGIYFEDSLKFLVERRLQPRLPVFGFVSFRDYYRLIKYGRECEREFDEIVERVTTNETYFFREAYQLRAFTDEILPMVVAQRSEGRIRVWSAGCSTGEEPYSIAMLLDKCPIVAGRPVDVFGNDISRKVLRTARAGMYTQASFRSTDNAYIKEYFHRDGRTYQLDERIRNRVTFGHLNLMDENALALIGKVDVILCRNVIIYFNHASRARLLATFYRKLRPGGFLLLGHSESLVNETKDFELAPLTNDMVYRKPGEGSLL
ncbi:MAG: chemotaxis protein CheR [Deltaproteobacteria bacterium RIFOXYA12_FULL_58_15]|nr:MAG: chemotaxis protein CheR [Deltaproteobacteria bacterium RIFOXYA12_FULL_58_15]OGR11268.1 MAG: chemotaxis protein CheR [Deltaproteobacteria bacterium RIFOXYB12_FULL_58_9]